MTSFHKAASLALLLLPLLLLVPVGAFASETTTGSGNFVATITTFKTIFSHDGYTLYYFAGPDVFSGTLTGAATFTFYQLVLPSGASFGAGTVTCPCTVAGKTGTIDIRFTTQSPGGGAGTGQAEETGSGGLAGFQGHATFSYVVTSTGFNGPYQVHYTFGEHDE